MLAYEYCLLLEYYWMSLICFMIHVDASSNYFSYEGLSPGTPFYIEKAISLMVFQMYGYWCALCS